MSLLSFTIPSDEDGIVGQSYFTALAYLIQGTKAAVNPAWGAAGLPDTRAMAAVFAR